MLFPRICTWSNLRPFVLPTEWERWDQRKTFCLICGAAISYVCGLALATVEGHIFWTVAFVLEVGGLVLFVSVTSIFWLILQSLVGGSRRCAQRVLNSLSSCRRSKEILQTCFLSCMGTGAVASLKRRAFMQDFGGTGVVQFVQACAQVVAIVVLGMIGLFIARNLIFLSTYKVALAARRSYSYFFIKPMHMTVPDLSKEASGECSVCLRSLADDDGKGVLRLFCTHTFHISCINRWLVVKEACPVCRTSVRTYRSCVHILQDQCVSECAKKMHAESLEPVEIDAVPVDVEADPVDIEAAPATSGGAVLDVEFASPRRCSSGASAGHCGEQTPDPSHRTDTTGTGATSSPASALTGSPVSETPVPKERHRKRRSDKPKRKHPKPARSPRSPQWSARPSEESNAASLRDEAVSNWDLGAPVQGRILSRSSAGSQSSASSVGSIDSMDSVGSIESEAHAITPHAPQPVKTELNLRREVNLDLDPAVLLRSLQSASGPIDVETNVDLDDFLLQRAVSTALSVRAV